MLKQVPDLFLNPFALPRGSSRGWCRRSSAAKLRFCGRQVLTNFRDGPQYRFRQFLDHVKLTKLVRNLAKHLQNRLGIQGRPVGCDSLECQTALFESRLECAKKAFYVDMSGIVIEHFIGQPAKGAVVDDREHAERAIVQFVRSDVSRKVGQRVIKIFAGDAALRLFPPRPRPSFESWRKARRRDDLSRDANSPRGKAGHPRPPPARPRR